MPIGAGQFIGAALCSIAGPAGYFLLPAVAVGAEVAKGVMGDDHPLVGAIATVSTHVFSHLTGDKAQSLIEKLGEPGVNHDLEKVFIDSMSVALEKAGEGLTPKQQRDYQDWFGDWEGRFTWARKDATSTSDLFRGKEAFDPVTLASASDAEAWKAFRATLERWAWEQQTHGKKLLIGLGDPKPLPEALNAHLQQELPRYIEQAVPLALRTKENGAGWIAWQQRFLESTYFEVRGVNENLARVIQDLANLGGIPALFEKILERFDRHDQKLDEVLNGLEQIKALRTLMGDTSTVDPAGYLRTIWSLTQSIDLKHFQPPDGTVRQFFIERLYTKLTTILTAVIPEEGPARLTEFEKPMRAGDIPLHEALKSHPLLVLVGDPGSGKTTFLRRIAFELCHVGLGRNRVADDGRSRPIERLTEYEWDTLPILVDAKELAAHIWSGGVAPRGALSRASDPEWLFHFLGDTYGLKTDYFRSQAERGCVLLVDAFDEVPDEVHREKIGELLRLLAGDERYPKTSIVGTSRPGENGGLTSIAKFQTARIAPLADEEIDVFVRNWGDAVHRTKPDAASALTKTLREELRRPQVRILAKNPMMLTALAVLHFAEKARLPEQRSELYKYILEWLAKVRAARRHDGAGHRDFLAKMRLLAMRMSAGTGEMRAEIKVEEAIDVLEDDFQQHSNPEKRRLAARTFLLEEETHSGLIIKSGSNVRFWHLTFREALTAQALALSERKRISLLFGENKLYDPKWRETVLLLAGELKALYDNSEVNEFLAEMLKRAEEPNAGLAGRARCVGLMGLLLKDLAAWQYSMTEELSARYKAMLAQVEEIFHKEKAYQIPFEVRLEAANALGLAGDPRLDRDNRIPLRGGHFIGRYPVTIHEYERFTEDGGYAVPEYWRAGGFGDFTEPDSWQDQLEQPKNRPVTGVNWYEASAYCALARGRLPREAEWESAARAGRKSVEYPWGNEEPDKTRANYGYDGSPNAPTPVGLYPAGATPTGIQDMAGNVWEWVEDDYDSKNKVLRGGSWDYNPGSLRVSTRYRNLPVDRNGNLGFRCVWE